MKYKFPHFFSYLYQLKSDISRPDPNSCAPAEIVKDIEEQLSADILQQNSFVSLVNSALIFRLDSHYVQLAAKALRSVKYQIKQTDNKDQIFSVLMWFNYNGHSAKSN